MEMAEVALHAMESKEREMKAKKEIVDEMRRESSMMVQQLKAEKAAIASKDRVLHAEVPIHSCTITTS